MDERIMSDEEILEVLGIPPTVVGTREYKELEQKENLIGSEQMLDEILAKRMWSNAEIIWVLKRLIFYYGKKDAVLKKAPPERLFMNMVDVLRAFFLLMDKMDPDIDDNMRSYISTKLADSTWGINSRTRNYLFKIKD